VCLGHQVIAHAFGAEIERASTPMHGRAVRVQHDGRGVFHGLESPLTLARYNSLTVTGSAPTCLEISARSEEGDVMGLRHKTWPLEGVQFHPESVLSEGGMDLLANFLRT
jgi:para-aminobenzoate synthetase component 2